MAFFYLETLLSLNINFVFPFSIRVSISCVLAALGFVMVAFAQTEWVALFGVAITSLASGLG